MSRPTAILPPDRLVDRLRRAMYAHGASGYRVPLTAVATASTLLGAPSLLTPTVKALAEPKRTAALTRSLWQAMIRGFPYLAGRIDALTGWLAEERDYEVGALASCFEVLAGCDLEGSVDRADGDLLGLMYMLLMSKNDAQHRGAFYTPMSVSVLLARMTLVPKEGISVADPCSGSGGMILAAIRVIREAGLDPDTCTWVLNDIDPTAVALAGVNLASRGMHRVILTCGDGLLLGTGVDGDPLLTVPGRRSRKTSEAA